MGINDFKVAKVEIPNITQFSIGNQFAMQGERNGRGLVVHVTDNGVVEPQTGLSLNLGWKHQTAKNKAGEQLQGLDAFTAVDRQTGLFRIEYTSAMMTPGVVDAVIEFITGDSVTRSKPFAIIVNRSPFDEDAATSDNSFSALQAELIKAQNLNAGPVDTVSSYDELLEKYPNGAGGSVIVKEPDGKSGYVYTYNGSIWNKSVPYIPMDIADKSIGPNQTVFLKELESKNYFDKYNSWVQIGSFINESGYWVSGSSTYSYTGKIIAQPNDSFYVCTIAGIQSVYGAAFDVNGKWLETIKRNAGKWLAPSRSDLAYVRFAFMTSTLDSLMILKNEAEVPTEYIPFKHELVDGIVIDEKNVEGLDKKVWSQKNVDFIDVKRTVNLFNKNDSRNTVGRVIDKNGVWINYAPYSQSHYFEVSPGDVIRKGDSGYGWTFDENFNKVVLIPDTPYTWIIPSDSKIKYASFAYQTANKDSLVIVKNQELPADYIPYELGTIASNVLIDESQVVRKGRTGRKIYGIGDSISTTIFASNPYWREINDRSTEISITMDAISSSRITQKSDRTDSLMERYQKVTEGFDSIFVFMGTNDASNILPIGDNSSMDGSTLKGSMNTAITYWMENYPKMKIAFITPIQRNGNLSGRLRQYSDAIIEICEIYGIRYFDGMKNSPYLSNATVRAALGEDGLHLNNDGHLIISNPIENFLDSL